MSNSSQKNKQKPLPKTEAEMPIIKDPINHFVRIKTDVSTFVGGMGVTDTIRSSKPYLSRDNGNGSVVISDSDTTLDVGVLLLKDVEILPEVRGFFDETTECPDIDIRIMGVESRMECIKQTQKRFNIPDENVFIDENHEGCLANAKKAWLAPTDKSHILVLQDDIELCDNFIDYLNTIVKAHPKAVISLFPIQFIHGSSRSIPASPYVKANAVSGCGVIIPTKLVPECIESWDESIRGDDTNICNWANSNNISIITTLPSTIQHIGDVSVNTPGLHIGRTAFYRKDLSKYDFQNKDITLWNDITR